MSPRETHQAGLDIESSDDFLENAFDTAFEILAPQSAYLSNQPHGTAFGSGDERLYAPSYEFFSLLTWSVSLSLLSGMVAAASFQRWFARPRSALSSDETEELKQQLLEELRSNINRATGSPVAPEQARRAAIDILREHGWPEGDATRAVHLITSELCKLSSALSGTGTSQPASSRDDTLRVTIELARRKDIDDPFAFDFAEQTYVQRRDGGTFVTAPFPWSPSMLADLAALSSTAPARGAARRLGDLLRDFLYQLGWRHEEALLHDAVEARRPIRIRFRSAAAELYALPWELVPVEPSGQPLGAIPDCLVEYEWPAVRSSSFPEPALTGRILFAWSGHVPAAQHLHAITRACERARYPFDVTRDVIAHASLDRLLSELERSRESVAALHLLCHGGEVEPGVLGLCLSPSQSRGEPLPVSADDLGRALGPFVHKIQRVVLCACRGGDASIPTQRISSTAQTLHRLGIPAVVASRMLLSTEGSVCLAEALFEDLLAKSAPMTQAFLAARQRLVGLPGNQDWMALQLYTASGHAPANPSRPMPL